MGTTRARVRAAALATAVVLAACGSSDARTGAAGVPSPAMSRPAAEPPGSGPTGTSPPVPPGPTGQPSGVPEPTSAAPGSRPPRDPSPRSPGAGPGRAPLSVTPPGPLPTSAAGLVVVPTSGVPGPVPRACLPPGFVLPQGSVAVRGTAESPCRPGSGTFYVQVHGARQDVVVSFLKTVYASRWTLLVEVADKQVVVVGGSPPQRELVGNTQVWQETPTRGRTLTFTTYTLAGVTTVQVVYSDGVPPP